MGFIRFLVIELLSITSRKGILRLQYSTGATKKPSRDESREGLKKLAIPTFALVGTIIGSESLTTVFGMGTGISFRIWSPERARRRRSQRDLLSAGDSDGLVMRKSGRYSLA